MLSPLMKLPSVTGTAASKRKIRRPGRRIKDTRPGGHEGNRRFANVSRLGNRESPEGKQRDSQKLDLGCDNHGAARPRLSVRR